MRVQQEEILQKNRHRLHNGTSAGSRLYPITQTITRSEIGHNGIKINIDDELDDELLLDSEEYKVNLEKARKREVDGAVRKLLHETLKKEGYFEVRDLLTKIDTLRCENSILRLKCGDDSGTYRCPAWHASNAEMELLKATHEEELSALSAKHQEEIKALFGQLEEMKDELLGEKENYLEFKHNHCTQIEKIEKKMRALQEKNETLVLKNKELVVMINTFVSENSEPEKKSCCQMVVESCQSDCLIT